MKHGQCSTMKIKTSWLALRCDVVIYKSLEDKESQATIAPLSLVQIW